MQRSPQAKNTYVKQGRERLLSLCCGLISEQNNFMFNINCQCSSVLKKTCLSVLTLSEKIDFPVIQKMQIRKERFDLHD